MLKIILSMEASGGCIVPILDYRGLFCSKGVFFSLDVYICKLSKGRVFTSWSIEKGRNQSGLCQSLNMKLCWSRWTMSVKAIKLDYVIFFYYWTYTFFCKKNYITVKIFIWLHYIVCMACAGYKRGCEWSFKNSGSSKILVELQESCSLVF